MGPPPYRLSLLFKLVEVKVVSVHLSGVLGTLGAVFLGSCAGGLFLFGCTIAGRLGSSSIAFTSDLDPCGILGAVFCVQPRS